MIDLPHQALMLQALQWEGRGCEIATLPLSVKENVREVSPPDTAEYAEDVVRSQ